MPDYRTKLFLSHASDDKPAIANDLAEALRADFDVWYDEYELTIGDSLLAKISEGLRAADFGVVILSKSFFGKKWTQSELDGLFSLEEANRKVILPVWHNVTLDEVKAYSLILAGRLGIDSARGVPAIVSAIHAAVDASNRTAMFNTAGSIKSRFIRIDGELAGERRSKNILNSTEGVRLVREAADRCAAEVLKLAADTAADSQLLKFQLGDGLNDSNQRIISVRMPFHLTFSLQYFNSTINSAEAAALSIGIWHDSRDAWGEITDRKKLVEHHFLPRIGDNNKVTWKSGEKEFGENQAPTFFLELMISEVEKAYEAKKNG